jgi:hypothetical protein
MSWDAYRYPTRVGETGRCKMSWIGIERLSTQTLLDLLEVPQRARSAGTCRRLAHVMRGLGWTPIRGRGLTQGGFRDQVRGWARDRKGSTLF